MDEPNQHLRRARQRAALTQGQLADAVADHVQQRTGTRPGIDADYLSNLERGVIRWPNTHYRAAMRSILGARTDSELGFRSARVARPARQPAAAVPPDDPDALIRHASAATMGVLNMKFAAPALAHERVDAGDVADLHQVCDAIERSDHAAGGGTVWRRVAMDQLAEAQTTARTASFRRPEVRVGWLSALARLGRLAGFMSADAGDHQVARGAYLSALTVAADADDWQIRVNILAGMARQAIQIGDGGTALKLTSLARAGEDDASATTQAMLYVVRARAYGLLRDPDRAMTAVSRAEDLFADREPAADPPWLWYYDAAQLAGDTGHALWPLAMRGSLEVSEAADRLARAVELHCADDTRGRTFSLARLATLQVRYRPGIEAYALAAETVDAVRGLRSGRARDDLRSLGKHLRQIDDDRARELAADARAVLRGGE